MNDEPIKKNQHLSNISERLEQVNTEVEHNEQQYKKYEEYLSSEIDSEEKKKLDALRKAGEKVLAEEVERRSAKRNTENFEEKEIKEDYKDYNKEPKADFDNAVLKAVSEVQGIYAKVEAIAQIYREYGKRSESAENFLERRSLKAKEYSNENLKALKEKVNDLQIKQETIRQIDARVRDCKETLSYLGTFDFKRKKQLNSTVKALEQKKQNELNKFEKEYGTDSKNLVITVKNYQKQLEEAKDNFYRENGHPTSEKIGIKEQIKMAQEKVQTQAFERSR